MSISTFFGLETALRGVQAEQQAVDTTSHNITNANTAGYSRQEAVFSATDPLGIVLGSKNRPEAQVGSGVEVTDFRRMRDTFLDLQYRAQAMQVGYQTTRSDQLGQVQASLSEPGDNGISAQLQKFWSAWADVSNDPSNQAARQALVDQGKNLAASFNALDQQLVTVKAGANAEYASLTGASGDVAQMAGEIAQLDGAIKSAVQNGSKPNDLLDRRDLLLDNLSKLGQVSVTDLGNGSLRVQFGDAAQPLLNDQSVTWPQTLTKPGGKLGALLDLGSIGGYVDGYRATLNGVAKSLADSVNAIHTTGSPSGVKFFNYTAGLEAGTLSVAVSAATVVSSSSGAADANDIALAISQLRGGAADQAYASYVGKVGSDVKDAQTSSATGTVLLNSIDDRRQSASGVSMDEEMSNLVRFQRGYQASARAMSTVDEMLDQLINRTGKVGL